jgi:glycosyltransferase involved in cell wall biosynthesis
MDGKHVLMLLSNAFDPDPRVHREACALLASGYRVTILAWDRDEKAPARETVDGIEVRRVYVRSTHGRGLTQVYFLALFWLLAYRQALRMDFDIVHAHDFDTLPLGYAVSRFRRKRLVYDSHESYVDMLMNMPATAKRAIVAVENWMLRRADLVITVGDLLREHLASRGARKAVVVGNWQDRDQFVQDPGTIEATRRELGIRDGQKAVCFIAHLTHERKIPELLAAARMSPGIQVVLGGDGAGRPLAEKAAAESPNVTYLGRVAPARIPLYTLACDAVFYGFDPSNANARFSAPNKLFEALAAGKPIITGNFGEIGRIVSRERCGIVLPDYSPESIRDAFARLTGPDCEEMGQVAARLAASTYNLREASRVLIREYAGFGGSSTGSHERECAGGTIQ